MKTRGTMYRALINRADMLELAELSALRHMRKALVMGRNDYLVELYATVANDLATDARDMRATATDILRG